MVWFGWDQAVWSVADQVGPAGFLQGLQSQGVVFGLGILEQGPLQTFLRQIRYMDRLERLRIESGVIHGRGDGSGGGIEILDLFWDHTIGFDIQGQLDRILQGRARMSGNQIGDQELFFAQLGIDLFIPLLESLVNSRTGFAHRAQGAFTDVLRCHFQLPTDMMAADLFQETGLLIHQNGVKPDPGTDKDLFHTVERSNFLQDAQIRPVIGAQSRAWLRRDALAVLADPSLLLLGTARFKEIGGRSTEVMDIAFEIGVRDQGLCFVYNRRFAAPGDDPAMMEGDGAEMATAVATAMAVDRKPDFFDRRHAALGHI